MGHPVLEKTYDAYEAVNNLKETYQEDKQANLENQVFHFFNIWVYYTLSNLTLSVSIFGKA